MLQGPGVTVEHDPLLGDGGQHRVLDRCVALGFSVLQDVGVVAGPASNRTAEVEELSHPEVVAKLDGSRTNDEEVDVAVDAHVAACRRAEERGAGTGDLPPMELRAEPG